MSLYLNKDCVEVQGVWMGQELKSLNCTGTNSNYCKICRNCLHYSFKVQNKIYNYYAQNEYDLRDDLKIGDNVNIKMCWNKKLNGFTTKHIFKNE